MLNSFFWLLCGLWSGIGGAIFTWFSLRKKVAAGTFSDHEVKSFSRGMAFWICVPCVLLWAIQMSIPGPVPPFFVEWPAPQKYLAIAIAGFLWTALIYWTFLLNGAETLSRFRSATRTGPAFMNSPVAMKLWVVAAVAAGIIALMLAP